MADTIISVYDGKQHKNISCNKILQDGKPTGFYQYEKSEITSNFGTYLDNLVNYNLFTQHVTLLSKNNYNFLLTDYGSRYFLITRHVGYGKTPLHTFKQVQDAINMILKELGYVHQEYIFSQTPPCIEFTITPRDGSEDFKLFFLPMDNQCYQIN